jgi:hypothetical protein
MKKYFLLLISISGLYSPLFSQNDFFPLSVGNYFEYQYKSIQTEYESLFAMLETKDSGTVNFEVISVTDKDSIFEWTIKEIDSLIRTIDTLYNGIGIDTVFDISSVSTYIMIEMKDSLNNIMFNPRTEIWESPTRWHSPYLGIVYGESLHRYSDEDSLMYLIQYDNSYYNHSMWDSLTFCKNIGLISAKSSIWKGPNTLYNYAWSSKLIDYKVITDVNDYITIPYFGLSQNFPNPFNPKTTIKYSVPQTSFITIKIYDILGREITTLINQEIYAGNYEIEFDGANLASGIYFYRMQALNFASTKKLILIK